MTVPYEDAGDLPDGGLLPERRRSVSVVIKPISRVVSVDLSLTPEQAHALYNEIYALLREHGISSVKHRHLRSIPTLYDLYDALNAIGIDGTGQTPS